MNNQTRKHDPTLLVPQHQETLTKKQNSNKLQKPFRLLQIYNLAISLLQASSWHHLCKPLLRSNLQAPQQERLQPEGQDHQEEEDRTSQTPSRTLLGPLEEGIRVAEGEILEEEAGVIREETLVKEETPAEEETPPHPMTNYQGNNPLSSKETAKNQKHSYKNGTSIGGSITLPLK